MTIVTTTSSSGPYGGGTTFPVTFQSAGVNEIEVLNNGVVVSPSSYTFVRDADGTGDVIANPALSGPVVINSNPSFQQTTEFSKHGAWDPSMLNGPLDKAAVKLIYLKNRIASFQATVSALAVSVTTTIADAASAAQNVLDNAVFTVTSATGQTVTARAMLANIIGPANGQVAHLTEEGREGTFIYRTGNYSASVAADTFQGLYVAPMQYSDGSVGAWVRQVQGDTYFLSWWGFSTATLADNHLRVRSAEALRPAGSTLVFPAGTFTGFGGTTGSTTEPNVAMYKSGVWRGQGDATVITPGNSASYCIGMNASGCLIERLTFANWHVARGANSPACIDITRHHSSMLNSNQGPGEVQGSKVSNCTFRNLTAAIRVINMLYDTDANDTDASTAVAVNHPSDIQITGNRLIDVDYQGISLWGRRIRVTDNHIQMRKTVVKGDGTFNAVDDFDCAIRVSGASHCIVASNTIRCLTPFRAFVINQSIQSGDKSTPSNLEGGIEVSDPRWIHINNNEVLMREGLSAISVVAFAGLIYFGNNTIRCRPEVTDHTFAMIAVAGGARLQQGGMFVVDGGVYDGYPTICEANAVAGLGRFIFRNGVSTGTQATGSNLLNGYFNFGFPYGNDYNGDPMKPIPSVEIDNWSHLSNHIAFAFARYNEIPAGAYISVRNCRGPNGTTIWAAGGGSGTGTVQESGNTTYPANFNTFSQPGGTGGYYGQPRYSDNGPLFWNGLYDTYTASLADPNLKIPADVEEDHDA